MKFSIGSLREAIKRSKPGQDGPRHGHDNGQSESSAMKPEQQSQSTARGIVSKSTQPDTKPMRLSMGGLRQAITKAQRGQAKSGHGHDEQADSEAIKPGQRSHETARETVPRPKAPDMPTMSVQEAQAPAATNPDFRIWSKLSKNPPRLLGSPVEITDFAQLTQLTSGSHSKVQPELVQTSYVYQPLPQGQIRLLEVQGLGAVPIVKVAAHSLDSCPPFIALSYAWDRGGTKRFFYCDGSSFLVQDTVHAAINSIGLNFASSRLLLWIDGICINQDDAAEKAEQVAMMGKIYSQAEKVVIWLGPAMNGSDLAIAHLPGLLKWAASLRSSFRVPGQPLQLPEDVPVEAVAAFGHLYTRAWFNRAWTVQEVFLAKTKTFLCGGRLVEWQDFATITYDLAFSFLALDLVLPGLAKGIIDRPVRNMLLMVRTKESLDLPVSGFSLLVLVDFCRSRDITEPVDRVWAFLGLAQPWLQKYMRPLVSYAEVERRDYCHTYTNFGKAMFTSSSNPSLLSFASSVDRPSSLPSWCPNFHSQRDCGRLEANGWGFTAGMPVSQPEKHRQTIRFRQGSDILSLSGFRFDKVDQVVSPGRADVAQDGQSANQNPSARRARAAWERRCLELAKKLFPGKDRSADDDGETLPLGHVRVLTADQLFAYHEDIEQMMSAYEAYCGYLECDRISEILLPEDRARLCMFLHTASMLFGRVYFSTSDGRLGLGPPGLRAGDNLVIIYGAMTPFALRFDAAVDGTAQLVGDVFIDGIMYGQAESTGRDETFHLR
ncbi:hypothetical protein NLG97_g4653 [Lecanicillium saksenae]|uniref:Uncharacterized protein n=1 Tax=Lecanicillium saksenae TaxID=468837 RepID=A0ACC1QUQ1_9HYPO|nr:hypothetical protein NLG97_g4653 [Lecanicillium saksenae]